MPGGSWRCAVAFAAVAFWAAQGAPAAVREFNAVEALAQSQVEALRAVDGKVVPAESTGVPLAEDDNDLRVLLPFEEQHEINVIYTRFAQCTRNLASPLDEAVLELPERLKIVEGRHGKAFAFNGGRLCAPLPRLSLREILNSGCTLFAWVKPDGLSGRQTVAVCFVDNNWLPFNLGIRDGKLEATCRLIYLKGQTLTVKGKTDLKKGEWQHVAAALDPFRNEIRLYLDGRRDGESPCPVPTNALPQSLRFLAGGYPTTDRDVFRGVMDDAGLLTRPISDSQAADLHAGKARRGALVSREVPLDGSYNTLRLSVKESNPGTAQVFIRQSDAWHRARQGQELICDMPARMPLTALQYKVVLAGDTALGSVRFEFENRQYIPATNKFSFLVMGDSHLSPMPQVIRWAYETFPDLALVTGPGDVAGVPDFDGAYRSQWGQNPRAWPGLFPWFLAPGNHDIEYPRFADYMVKRLGPAAAMALPGMRNFREGPFDTYQEYGNYQDRFLQYSFDYQSAHFVIINVYFHDVVLPAGKDDKAEHNRMVGLHGKPKPYAPTGSVNEDLLKWLDADLSTTPAKFKFLFFHEGAFPVPGGRHAGDSLDNPHYPGNSGPGNTRPMRDRFWSLLSSHGVTATFVGHSHGTAQTWAADPAGKGAPVYEFEGGGVMARKNPVIVSIDGDTAAVRQYTTSVNAYDFRESRRPVVFSKAAVASNSAPHIEHFDAKFEGGYPVSTQTEYRLEVGDNLERLDSLYFEARDNDLRDRITFSFSNLPAFFKVHDESQSFRRVHLGGRTLTEADVGSYTFDVVASDGKKEDRLKITVHVLRGEKPSILGWTIPDGSTHTHLKRVLFFCRDNAEVTLGRCEQFFRVKINGQSTEGWSRYGKALSDDLAWIGVRAKGEKGFEPGAYEISAFCQDGRGVASEPATLKFSVADDGRPAETVKPWVEGLYPPAGLTVPSLPRISIWLNTLTGNDVTRHTKVELTKDGRPVALRAVGSGDADAPRWGDLDLLPETALGHGEYTLRVTPAVEKDGREWSGDTYTATMTVAAHP